MVDEYLTLHKETFELEHSIEEHEHADLSSGAEAENRAKLLQAAGSGFSGCANVASVVDERWVSDKRLTDAA